jgi:hypothetical protein
MSTSKVTLPRFELGQVVVTPRAESALRACGQTVESILARHQAGDWGDASEVERQCNEEGVSRHYNVVSRYRTRDGENITITTRADRACTMVHLGPTNG